MTKTIFFCDLEFCSKEIIWNLACLREAASAKAGACDLVLIIALCAMRLAALV